MSLQLSKLPSRTIALLAAATGLTGTVFYYSLTQFAQTNAAPPTEPVATIQRIVALGRLEPETEVVKVSTPAALNNDRVAQLLIRRGDRVEAGQVIAILDSYDRLQTALVEAQEQVRVAQSRLAQVQAGAKTGEIAAQEALIGRLQAELQGERVTQDATIARWQSEVENAQSEYDRYVVLHQQGAISASDLDSRRLVLETAQAQLRENQANQNRTIDTLQAQIQEATATLNQIAEVRPVDVQVAQAEVNQAMAAVSRAEAELSQASIRAPIAGQILEIYAKPGEVVGDEGIADLGQTNQMQVVAEIYQSDIGSVREGQQATITGESFAGELRGTVHEIGLQVSRQEVFSQQPGENLDQRVVKVRIRLHPEDSQRVAGLTNLQVQVALLK